MTKIFKITFLLLLVFKISNAQPVLVTVDANAEKRPVSHYIFGKNNVLPSTFLNNGSNTEVTKANEAGVRFVRQGGGNNSTKYNWRLKLSSHPDWYNNVYANNWDAAVKNLTDKMPGVQGMWSFQLLGKVAANAQNNFPDWTYNSSKWWDGVHQNLAGGGVVNPAGGGMALDILDIHYFPSSSNAEQLVQFYRVFFDRNYVYPEANGVKTVNGGWDNSINKEFILGRCSDWLKKYMGENHTVKFGVTECGLNTSDANVHASWYASTLGEFMKNGVEIFTPWSWNPGMWETLHLFSRYSQKYFVDATSTQETYISAYPTLNENSDSMAIFLINLHTTQAKEIQLDVRNFILKNEPIYLYTLSKLPSTETFVSHTQNALKKKQIDKPEYHISVQLEPLSVNAIVLKTASTSARPIQSESFGLKVFPNPSPGKINIEFILNDNSPVNIELFNNNGQKVETLSVSGYSEGKNRIESDLTPYPSGLYWITVQSKNFTETKKFILNR